MNDLISVIVPVYNVDMFLNRCLNSIINQTYKNLEIIVVDDGSTDNSGKICDDFSKIDSRIFVIHKENGGLSSARNAGLDVIHGKYVTFVDSDDYISSDCIEYLYDLILKTDSSIAIGNYGFTKENQHKFEKVDEVVQQISGIEAINRQFGKNTVQYVSAWAKLYSSSLFDEIRFPNGMVHEDEGTTYKVLYLSSKIVVSNKVIYAYYYNGDSITKRPKKNNYDDLCFILKEQMDFYKNMEENVLCARVRNRYCIQAAAHYSLDGYYGSPQKIRNDAKNMYKGVWKIKDIPFSERFKGLLCSYLCGFSAKLMSLSNHS